MAKSNKTSSVLRLVGASDLKTEQADNKYNEDKTQNNIDFVKNNNEKNIKDNESVKKIDTDEADFYKKKRRKTVTKNIKSKNFVWNAVPVIKIDSEEPIIYQRHGSERQIVNVSALLINEQLGAALERFNSCKCDLCCRIITEIAMTQMPDCFIHVNFKPDEDKVNSAAKELRPEAIKILTRLCISARTHPYHEVYYNGDYDNNDDGY